MLTDAAGLYRDTLVGDITEARDTAAWEAAHWLLRYRRVPTLLEFGATRSVESNLAPKISAPLVFGILACELGSEFGIGR